MQKALFPGKFDPPTLGHLEIIQRAAALFEQLYVAVFEGQPGDRFSFTAQERVELLLMASKALSNVHVISFSGLAVECARRVQADCLVRGLRNGNDFAVEYQMASSNRKLSNIETLFIPSSPQYVHLNATLVKEIAANGHSLHGFVPEVIEPFIAAKMQL